MLILNITSASRVHLHPKPQILPVWEATVLQGPGPHNSNTAYKWMDRWTCREGALLILLRLSLRQCFWLGVGGHSFTSTPRKRFYRQRQAVHPFVWQLSFTLHDSFCYSRRSHGKGDTGSAVTS